MGIKGAEDPHKNQFPDEEECDDESDCECDGQKYSTVYILLTQILFIFTILKLQM